MLSVRSQYLNALNIPEYLHHAKENPAKQVKLTSIKCLVVEMDTQDSICNTGEAQVFLFKMLGAIGLQEDQVACIKATPDTLIQKISTYDASVILLTDQRLTLTKKSVFNMLHPSEVLKNDQFKREAWEVLKQVKKCLV
ncbi:hypothetical protein [Candidatus Thioglobus sp.]|jgi:hypothetical protein|uniref:hypothetical protein n=1 Tax=Candidatus Thioglobus sp. TaxID=2026721 RepID=UPI0017639E1F|nr:hypothetical protein [Candidatus Thioglobus sp.]HIB97486.1 hypothetical protein [Candidatus Thioglobus sp.]HIF47077.1 hypothetical protein [Candidatus Thioglobus sp.]HIL04043.1 hypothetical protein [Candidatus Thioglobus autotrophicus]